MAKYSYEQRMKVVLEVIEKHLSYEAAGKQSGCGKTQVYRWVKRNERFGSDGLSLKHGTYTGDFKQHVIEYMHENHLSISETSVLFGIPTDSTVGKWEHIYYEEGPTAFYRNDLGRKISMPFDKPKKQKPKNEQEKALLAEIEQLRMENAYLKKLNALVQERIARESGKKQPPSKN